MSIDFTIHEPGIALITINRPEKRNALDAEHYEGISRAWQRVRDDNEIRAAIITGAGDKSFCAGADLKTKATDKGEMAEFWQTQKDMLLNRGLEVWKPVIAAVNGFCLGGGMTLLMATDIRVAVPKATFGLSEVKRGIIAANGGTQRAIRQLPHAIAMDMLLTGRSVSAAEAERWGMVNRVVEPEQLLEAAFEYAREIAKNAPLATMAAKELATRGPELGMAGGLRMEQMFNRILKESDDAREGARAFAEKRQPHFTCS